MLIPIKPSKGLARSRRRNDRHDETDVHLEVIPPRDNQVAKVGKAKRSGRTEAINRKAP
jgi:hypothetical protein